MQEITEHRSEGDDTNGGISITADEPNTEFGNASHVYTLDIVGGAPESGGAATAIVFQRGPTRLVGNNGLTLEALLAVGLHRIRGFQSGRLSCSENDTVIWHLEQALAACKERTAARVAAGVKGTYATLEKDRPF